MAITHKLTWSLAAQGQTVLAGAQTEAGSLQPIADITVPGATTNQAATIAIPTATLQSLFILADKDLTLKTNSTSSPANTFTLKAGSPLVWSQSQSYFPNPFSADVTTLYLTNAGTATARFQLYALGS